MSHDVPTRKGPDQHQPGFHRRDFLKGSGVAVAATAMATTGEDAQAQDAPKKLSTSAPQKIKLNVNGQERELTVEPRVTLMDALRNDLNLTACKDVCDRAVCGACTVHVDGKPVYSCTRLAIEFTKQKIVTAEALMTPTKTDAVIDAFVKHDGMQCGFCTPGFVMAVRGFCNSNPDATMDDCRKGLGGNICRCGTYDSVLKAAYEVAQTKTGGA